MAEATLIEDARSLKAYSISMEEAQIMNERNGHLHLSGVTVSSQELLRASGICMAWTIVVTRVDIGLRRAEAIPVRVRGAEMLLAHLS